MTSGLFCNIIQRPFLKSPYFAFVLCCIGLGLHFMLGYPGGMTPDSFDQYSQSLTLQFNPYHPPIMAFIWSILNNITSGPAVMLGFHLIILWASVFILYSANPNNPYRLIYLVLPFVPPLLSQNVMIWKDIGFSHCLLLSMSIYSYYKLRNNEAPKWVIISLLIIAFYAISVKFQAKFLTPIIIWYILSLCTFEKNYNKILSTVFLTAILTFANSSLTNLVSYTKPNWQYRNFFDIASIANDLNDENVLPTYIRKHPQYSFAKLQEKFSSEMADPMIWPEDRIYDFTDNPHDLQELREAFRVNVMTHPLLYLKHRITNFLWIMKTKYNASDFRIIDHGLAKPYKWNYSFSSIQFVVKKCLAYTPNIFTRNITFFLLLVMYICQYTCRFKTTPGIKLQVIQPYIVLSVAFSCIILFTTQAADYRYYYVVRLLTLFALPIALYNLRAKQEES